VGEVEYNLIELGDWEKAGFDSVDHAKDWVARLQDKTLAGDVSKEQAEKTVRDAMESQFQRAKQAKAQKQAAGIQQSTGPLSGKQGAGQDPVLSSVDAMAKGPEAQGPAPVPGAAGIGQPQAAGALSGVPAATDAPTFDYFSELRGQGGQDSFIADIQQQVKDEVITPKEAIALRDKRLAETTKVAGAKEKVAGERGFKDLDREDRQKHSIVIENIRARSRAEGKAASADTPQEEATAWIELAQENEGTIVKLRTAMLNPRAAASVAMARSMGIEGADPQAIQAKIGQLQEKTDAYYRESERIKPNLRSTTQVIKGAKNNPYTVTDSASHAQVPAGMWYNAPDGKLHQKQN